jgi:hypothetical protein
MLKESSRGKVEAWGVQLGRTAAWRSEVRGRRVRASRWYTRGLSDYAIDRTDEKHSSNHENIQEGVWRVKCSSCLQLSLQNRNHMTR